MLCSRKRGDSSVSGPNLVGPSHVAPPLNKSPIKKYHHHTHTHTHTPEILPCNHVNPCPAHPPHNRLYLNEDDLSFSMYHRASRIPQHSFAVQKHPTAPLTQAEASQALYQSFPAASSRLPPCLLRPSVSPASLAPCPAPLSLTSLSLSAGERCKRGLLHSSPLSIRSALQDTPLRESAQPPSSAASHWRSAVALSSYLLLERKKHKLGWRVLFSHSPALIALHTWH